MKHKLFMIATGCGACLRFGTSEDSVRRAVLREVGTDNGVESVREATAADIAWIRAMGVYVPEQ